MSSVSINININEWKKYCPNCGWTHKKCSKNYSEEDKTRHQQYVEKAKKRFGDKSLPLCYGCYCNQCECCEGCNLPHYITGSAIGNEIMNQTTLVQENNCLEKSKSEK